MALIVRVGCPGQHHPRAAAPREGDRRMAQHIQFSLTQLRPGGKHKQRDPDRALSIQEMRDRAIEIEAAPAADQREAGRLLPGWQRDVDAVAGLERRLHLGGSEARGLLEEGEALQVIEGELGGDSLRRVDNQSRTTPRRRRRGRASPRGPSATRPGSAGATDDARPGPPGRAWRRTGRAGRGARGPPACPRVRAPAAGPPARRESAGGSGAHSRRCPSTRSRSAAVASLSATGVISGSMSLHESMNRTSAR